MKGQKSVVNTQELESVVLKALMNPGGELWAWKYSDGDDVYVDVFVANNPARFVRTEWAMRLADLQGADPMDYENAREYARMTVQELIKSLQEDGYVVEEA